MDDDDDDEFLDDDFGEAYRSNDAGKKCTIFVVDASAKMFEKYAIDDDDNDCAFRRALNQNKTHTIDHVYVMQDIDEISAERIKELDKLLKSEDLLLTFKNLCGGHGRCDYSEALFLCIKRITSRTPYFQKRIVYLFTNEANPFGTNAQHRMSACKNADDLRSHNATFSVYPLIFEDDAFVFAVLEQLDPNVQNNFENISELEDDIPRKQYSSRNIAGMAFDLGNGLKFAVGIYSLLRPEKLPQPVVLDAEENEVVQRSHVYIDKKSGDEVPLLDQEIIRKREIGGETVVLSADEVEKLRRLTPPGILLLGFKPLSCLKITHHIRSSQYVYPLEKDILGSARMYRTLYEVCMKQKKIIICRYTQKENVPPKLVALVPQASNAGSNLEDETGSKFCYPGFHLVYLPFSEDKRDLSEQMTFPDGQWPEATKEQTEAARKFVKKLTANYFPEKFYNPALQKHYKVIEALALDYDEMPEVEDQIQPYFAHDTFRKRVEKELYEYRLATLPDDYNPEKKRITKTKKAGEASTGGNPKKAKPTSESLEYLANNRMLEMLTVAQLKMKSAEENISVKANAKKAEIIRAIEDNFGIS